MRISDWSSDVCSSDLRVARFAQFLQNDRLLALQFVGVETRRAHQIGDQIHAQRQIRSEEHTSELQSLMRISYAVFCLKKKKKKTSNRNTNNIDNTTTYNTRYTVDNHNIQHTYTI